MYMCVCVCVRRGDTDEQREHHTTLGMGGCSTAAVQMRHGEGWHDDVECLSGGVIYVSSFRYIEKPTEAYGFCQPVILRRYFIQMGYAKGACHRL